MVLFGKKKSFDLKGQFGFLDAYSEYRNSLYGEDRDIAGCCLITLELQGYSQNPELVILFESNIYWAIKCFMVFISTGVLSFWAYIYFRGQIYYFSNLCIKYMLPYAFNFTYFTI